MDPALLLRGFVLGFTIAAAVGPISLLVIRRTLAEGRVVGLASGIGVATADGLYGAVAAFGLTVVTSALIDQRRALGLIGGAFLLLLALRTIRSVPDQGSGPRPEATDRRGLLGAYGSTLALTLTNPMTILSFAALFVGLGIRGDDIPGAALLTAGVFAGSATWWIVLTTVVSVVRSRITDSGLRRINVASGLLIGGFACFAIWSALA